MIGPSENEDPIYRAMVAAFVADKRNRVIPAYGIRRKVIPLDSAAVDQEFKFQGDFVYVDYNSTGVATCKLNNTSEDSFPLLALAGVQNIPYDGLYLSWAAQPGLVLNLWYGYNSQFISPTSAIATIGSITNPVKIRDSDGNDIDGDLPATSLAATRRALWVRDIGGNPASSFSSSAALAANTAEQVVAPASNTNGILVFERHAITNTASNNTVTLLAKTSAPTSFGDGDIHYMLFQDTGGAWKIGPNIMDRPILIPAGKGLYWFSNVLETGARRWCTYTVL